MCLKAKNIIKAIFCALYLNMNRTITMATSITIDTMTPATMAKRAERGPLEVGSERKNFY